MAEKRDKSRSGQPWWATYAAQPLSTWNKFANATGFDLRAAIIEVRQVEDTTVGEKQTPCWLFGVDELELISAIRVGRVSVDLLRGRIIVQDARYRALAENAGDVAGCIEGPVEPVPQFVQDVYAGDVDCRNTLF